MPPIHEHIMERTVAADFSHCGKGLLKKARERCFAEFATALHKLAVANLAEARDVAGDRNIVRRVGNDQPGFLPSHKMLVTRMIERIAA